MKKNLLVAIIIVVVVGGAAFYGGMLYGKSAAAGTAAAANFRGAGGAGNFAIRGASGAGRGAAGTILSLDSKSVTVSVAGGGSKIVFFSDATKVSKTVSSATSDLVIGDNIVATGTTNSDGSISATDIQIRPAGMPFGAPGANANANRPTNGNAPAPVPAQ